ncbi:MAG: PIN domain-containing protein [Deltaproteobacteria bacterium]|nr:PIN domain-containing protein [Deltaproteobacteria bacterium]
MILLDTNALIWLEAGHMRARKLEKVETRLAVSPAALLEMQFLLELGRIRFKGSALISAMADDERWVVDDPPAAAWFEAARSLSWTRDPFDRLIVAHAVVRGWRLATSDTTVLQHLDRRMTLEL